MAIAAILSLAGTSIGTLGRYRQAQFDDAAAKVYAEADQRDARLMGKYRQQLAREAAIGAVAGLAAALLVSILRE